MNALTTTKTLAQAEIEAQEIVDNWAYRNALFGWLPLSGLVLGAGDMVMIRQIADAFGIGFFDADAVKAHLGGVVATTAGAVVAGEIFGAIPLIGWVAKSVGMSVKASFIGELVIEYFRERSPLAA